jgi:hypothetical protein
MFTRIRDILAEQYIGAIIIGMLTAQGILALVSAAMQPLVYYLQTQGRTQGGLFGAFEPAPYSWASWAVGFVTIGLYFLAAYGLLLWIYVRPAAAEAEPEPTEDEA